MGGLGGRLRPRVAGGLIIPPRADFAYRVAVLLHTRCVHGFDDCVIFGYRVGIRQVRVASLPADTGPVAPHSLQRTATATVSFSLSITTQSSLAQYGHSSAVDLDTGPPVNKAQTAHPLMRRGSLPWLSLPTMRPRSFGAVRMLEV